MSDGDELRDLLIEHSDHRAVRRVYGAYTDHDTAEIADYVEAMCVTDGALALVAADGAAEVFARWNGHGGRFEHLTVWPPWTVGGTDYATGAGLIEYLSAKDDVRPTPHERTPFVDEESLTGFSRRREE